MASEEDCLWFKTNKKIDSIRKTNITSRSENYSL